MKWELLVCALIFGCSGEADSVHRTSGGVAPVGVNSDGEQPEPEPTQVAVEMPPVQAADPVATSELDPMPTSEPVVDSEPPAMTAEPEPEPEPMPEPEPEPTVVPTAEPPPDVPPEEPRCDYSECYSEATDQTECVSVVLATEGSCERHAAFSQCTADSMFKVANCANECLDEEAVAAEVRCKAECYLSDVECKSALVAVDDKCDSESCTREASACVIDCYCAHNNDAPNAPTCSSNE